jgi:very-short-patch-repair endonuclease
MEADWEQGRVFLRVTVHGSTPCPPPPSELLGWLEEGWDDPQIEAKWREVKTAARRQPGASGQLLFGGADRGGERFDDDPSRRAALQRWMPVREAWRRVEAPVRRVNSLYQQLFEQYQRLRRSAERYGLYIGDYTLEVDSDALPSIRHPVVRQRCELHHDPVLQQISVVEADVPLELCGDVLALLGCEAVDLSSTARQMKSQSLGIDDPEVGGFVRSVVNPIFTTRVHYTDDAEDAEAAEATVRNGRVCFVMARGAGVAEALEALEARMEQAPELSSALLGMLVDTNAPGATVSERQHHTSAESHALLVKEANREQEEIVQALDRSGSAVVQGPPGTGKTHTIANVLGHLLAQGKSVLVTSHTSKALRVLRDKLPTPLQPLCVSILDQDARSKQQLEQSVMGIISRLNTAKSVYAERAQSAEEKRSRLSAIVQELQLQLRDAMSRDLEPVVVGGKRWEPLEAAKWLAEQGDSFRWIPGPLVAAIGMPLSAEELRSLYRSNTALRPQDEQALRQRRPHTSGILAPDEVQWLMQRMIRLQSIAAAHRIEAWSSMSGASREALEGFAERAAAAGAQLAAAQGLMASCVRDGRIGGARRGLWEDFCIESSELVQQVDQLQITVLRNQPRLTSALPVEETINALEELAVHVDGGGSLKGVLFGLKCYRNNSLRTVLAAATVAGRAPRSRADFEALKALVQAASCRVRIAARWQAQVVPAGGAAIPPAEMAEDFVRDKIAQIREAVRWHQDRFEPIVAEAGRLGLRWTEVRRLAGISDGATGETEQVSRMLCQILPSMIEARLASDEVRQVRVRLGSCIELLRQYAGNPLADGMQAALLGPDSSRYRQIFEELDRLERLEAAREQRESLLDRLETGAPAWARAIRERQPGFDGVLSAADPETSWNAAQIDAELNRRGEIDVMKVIGQLASALQQLRQATSDLVENRSWARQHDRVDTASRQALQGWMTTVNTPGFRTGKRSDTLQREAKKLLAKCRTAVPIWVMPLARVFETYDFATVKFDVVIVDEASQCDVLGLAAVAIADQVMVVGDDKQVSPSAVGEDLENAQRAIGQYLYGITNSHLFTGRLSLYDMAAWGLGQPHMLTEHFRCVDDIIEFSNALSYDGRILPLRDASDVKTRPFVVEHRAPRGMRSSTGKVNEGEAKEIARIIGAFCALPEYADKSIGVISMLGEEQVLVLDREIRKVLTTSEYEARSVLCGIPPHFQGDERDIILLSLVDSSESGGPLRSNSTNEDFKKRYNVAASRARDQLWVIHSLNPQTDLQEQDLRRRLIEHARDPGASRRARGRVEARAESPFELEVGRALVARGYRLIPQYQVGAFRIDFVAAGRTGRVAIECDGDRYHTIDELAADLDRQRILERLGWRFIRIRGGQYYRSKSGSIDEVCRELARLGIDPIGPEEAAPEGATAQAGASLAQKVLDRVRIAEAGHPATVGHVDSGNSVDDELDDEIENGSDSDADAAGDRLDGGIGDSPSPGAMDDALDASRSPVRGATACSGWEEVSSSPVPDQQVNRWLDDFVRVLRDVGRPLARQEAIDQTGMPPHLWRYVCEEAIQQGLVRRSGTKRGTRYSALQSSRSADRKPSESANPIESAMRAIEQALATLGRSATKEEIVVRIGQHSRLWSEALSELYRRKRLTRDRTAAGVRHKLVNGSE